MSKITAYGALAGGSLAAGDLLVVVDVSDTSMAATGTTKNLTAGALATGLAGLGPYLYGPAASKPAGVAGLGYYETDTFRWRQYDGTQWIVVYEPWQDYTSSVTFSNFTLSNGTVDYCRYKRDGEQVTYVGHVTLGSSSSMSTSPGVAAPFAVTTSANIPGAARFNDATGSEYGGAGSRINSGGQFVRLVGPTAAVSSTSPFTWATSDTFSWSITYPISAANAAA